jgi:O-antigen/teichoic acid export membrane protein
MTVSNIVSPVMVSMDRFLIGALVSLTAVTYYATPFEIVTKFLFVPAALMAVMFPAFSTSFALSPQRASTLYARCVKYLLLILFPVTLVTVSLAYPGLALWLGADFALHSFRALQWLAVGVFFNGLANAPFTLLQGTGRPDLTAKLHLIELPIYLCALWLLTVRYGIVGAAMAWAARVALDAAALAVLSSRLLPECSRVTRRSFVLASVALVFFAVAALSMSFSKLSLLYLAAVLLGFTLVAWFVALIPSERDLLKAPFKLSRIAFNLD